MNISVKYLFIESYSWNCLKSYMKYISDERKHRIEHFAFEKDKVISLLAELIIRSESATALDIDNTAVSFAYNPFGKPYLYNFPDYHFSVSHADDCIAFTASDQPIGIDTEKIAAYDFEIARRFFVPQEVSFIETSEDKNFAFYDIWTKKEAYLKMLGVGLSKPLQSFNIFDPALAPKFITKRLSNCIITLCTDYAINESRQIVFNEMKTIDILNKF